MINKNLPKILNKKSACFLTQCDMNTEEKKMTQKTIQLNLEAIEKQNAFLQTLIEKTSQDNTNLKLGDQLRPTEDYNGSLFEVVREPYWCYLDEQGRAVNIEILLCEEPFAEERLEAEEFMKRLESKRVDNPHDYHLGVIGNPWIKIGKQRVYEDSPGYDYLDDDDEKQDSNGQYYIEMPTYTVCWNEKKCPGGIIPQKRVWLRKICIISKAEGHTDDKNMRALPFPLKTLCFERLISKELQKLEKIGKTMSALNENHDRRGSRKAENRKKWTQLFQLWADRDLRERQVTGFYSDKYGLFLKSSVIYEVVARAVNPLTKLIDDVQQIKSGSKTDGQNLETKV
jgi:hypothetical protein